MSITVSLIHVLVVNEDLEMCQLWQRTIDLTPGMNCPGFALRSHQVPAMVAEYTPDVILLPTQLSDISGADVARDILRTQDDSLIIMFSADETQRQPALRAGAAEHLVLPVETDHLVKAILRVYKAHRK